MTTIQPYTPYTFNSPAIHGRGRSSDLFTSLFGDLLGGVNQWQSDLSYDEKEGVYSAEIDCAGYKRDEVAVEATDDTITVTAENKRRGRVTRAFYVPDIDTARITAKLEDGVLRLQAPRSVDSMPKRVQIE